MHFFSAARKTLIVSAVLAIIVALPLAGGITAGIADSRIDVGLDCYQFISPKPVLVWDASSKDGQARMEADPGEYGIPTSEVKDAPTALTVVEAPKKSPASSQAATSATLTSAPTVIKITHLPRYHGFIPRSALGHLRIEGLPANVHLHRLFIGSLYPTIYYTGGDAPAWNWGHKTFNWQPAIQGNALELPSISAIEQGGTLTWAAVAAVLFACATLFFFSLWVSLQLLLEIHTQPAPQGRLKPFRWPTFALFFFPCLLLWSAYLAAFYPAVMISDSTDQWHQARVMHLNDHHPAFHSLTLRALALGMNKPQLPAMAQILLLALCVSYACTLLLRAGAPKWAVGLVFLCLYLSPRNGSMVVNLWKDTLFGIAVFAFTLLLAHAYLDERVWNGWRNWIAAGIVLGLIPLFRHNGMAILAAFVLLAPLWFPGPARKRALVAAAIGFVMVFGVRKGLYPVLHVNPAFQQHFVFTAGVQTAAVIDQDVPLAKEEYQFLGAIRPFADRWGYDYLSGVNTIWPPNKKMKFNTKFACDHLAELRNLYLSLHTRYPLIFVNYLRHFAPFIFMPFETHVHITTYATDIWTNADGLVQHPLSGRLHRWILRGLALTDRPALNWLFWRPALALYLTLLALWLLLRRTRRWALLLLFMPVFNSTATILLAGDAQRQRFQFPLTLCMGFFLGLCLVKFDRKHTD